MFKRMKKITMGRIIMNYDVGYPDGTHKNEKGYIGHIIGTDSSDYLIEAPWGWIAVDSRINSGWYESSLAGKTLWWVTKRYIEVLNDSCGNCKNRCRSDKKCEFYQEWKAKGDEVK